MNKRYYVTEQFLRTHNNKHDITLSKNPRKKIKRRSAKKAPFISPDIKLRLLNAKRVQAQRTKGDKQPTTIAQDADRALFTLADLEYFPKYLRTKAIKLLSQLPQIGVKWNTAGEVIYRGTLHPSTHVFSLVDYAIRPPAKRKKHPLGVESFIDYLTEKGVLSPGANNKLLKSPSRLQTISIANNKRKMTLPLNEATQSSDSNSDNEEFHMSMQYHDKNEIDQAPGQLTFNRYK